MGVTAWDPHRNYPNFQPQQPPPQTVVAPQHKPKRASCAIQIKDPETGQAIDPTSDDKPSSRTVSESQKDEVSEAAPAPTVVATAVEEEKKSQLKRKYNKSKQVKMSPLPRTSKQLLMTTTAGRCPKQRKARVQRKPIMPKVIKIMARRIHENNQRNSQRKRKRRSKRSRKLSRSPRRLQ